MRYFFLGFLFVAAFSISYGQVDSRLKGEWRSKRDGKVEDVIRFSDRYLQSSILQDGLDFRIREDTYVYKCDESKIKKYDILDPTEERLVEAGGYSYRLVNDTTLEISSLVGGENSIRFTKTATTLLPFSKFSPGDFYGSNGSLPCYTRIIDDSVVTCYTFGLISFNTDIKEMKSLFGPPIKELPGENDVTSFIFPLKFNQRVSGYIVYSVKNGVVESLQMTGFTDDSRLKFSSIRLGDYYTYVEQRLGKPSSKRILKDIKAELWEYYSYKFSFEVKENKVISIRIYK